MTWREALERFKRELDLFTVVCAVLFGFSLGTLATCHRVEIERMTTAQCREWVQGYSDTAHEILNELEDCKARAHD